MLSIAVSAQGRKVEDCLRRMRPVGTDKELLAKGLLAQMDVQRSRIASSKREHSIGERTQKRMRESRSSET